MERSLKQPLGPNMKIEFWLCTTVTHAICYGVPSGGLLEQTVTSMLLDVQINLNSNKSSFKQMIVSNEEDPPQVS